MLAEPNLADPTGDAGKSSSTLGISLFGVLLQIGDQIGNLGIVLQPDEGHFRAFHLRLGIM
jgi:hypothetical protein